MQEEWPLTDLGFVTAFIPAGCHVCQIYSDAGERTDAVLRFLSRGLAAGETAAMFSDNVGNDEIETWLEHEHLSLSEEVGSGRLTLSGARDVYFAGGCFDPDRILTNLKKFHASSAEAGRTGARVIGEMTPEIHQVPGGSRLLEYESRVNRVLRETGVTAVCQYDARAFDGATIMDVLSVHPMMVVRGAVIKNPFFVAPEDLPQRTTA